MKTRFLFPILASLIIFLSCEKDDSARENFKIDDDFSFYFYEHYPNSNYVQPLEGDIFLKLMTKHVYMNSGYIVDMDITENKGVMNIILKGIEEPEIFLTTPGAAEGIIPLHKDIKTLKFINGENEDVFNVSITDEKAVFTPHKSTFVSCKDQTYFRRPENTFAFVCGTATDNQDLREEFLKQLLATVPLTEYHFESEGVIPWQTESSGCHVNFPTLFFTYKDEGDFEKAGKLLQTFSLKNISPLIGVVMNLEDWKGKFYYSWLND